jgi:anthranilate synthase component 1
VTALAGVPAGVIRPLVRRLADAPDPLGVYAALANGGARAHTFLLESADRTQPFAERSLIGARMALHVVAEPEATRVAALSPNGDAALPWVRDALADRGAVADGRSVRVPHPRAARCTDERLRFRQPSPLDVLRVLQQAARLASRPNDWCHILVGTLGYDLIDCFESLPRGGPDPLDQPVVECWLPDRLLVVDHARRQTTAVATAWGGDGFTARYHDATRDLEALVAAVRAGGVAPPRVDADGETDPLAPTAPADLDDVSFAALVQRLQHHLAQGDCYQIVPSRTFTAPCPDPLSAYARLRRRNPSPYLFFARGEHTVLFGASPEACLRVDGATRRVSITPIAGTAARGRAPDGRLDPDLDLRREVALRLDRKESAEHLMLVDLARNDVARVSEPGTRRVSRLLAVERYAHVMHLVSEVTGTLAPGVDALEAYAATMNMGTLVGAPKVRAAELLRLHEPSRRGAYGGAVGYLRDDDTLETAIVIRSAIVQGGIAHVRAGAGVVLDSDPAREAQETSRKAAAVLEALRTPELSRV